MGSTCNLKITGMADVQLKNKKGAKTSTSLYVVEGYEAEPLLGDKDAEALGFIIFNKEGRGSTPEAVSYTHLTLPTIPLV